MKVLSNFFVILIMAIISSGAALAACPVQSNTDFVYYDGPGASTYSVSWMEHFLEWWQDQDSSIDYLPVDDREIDDCTLENYAELDMYIQPGGDAYQQQKKIGSDGKAVINSFLNNGGSYFGVCAGFYYAAADYYWQGSYYDHSDLLGAYPGTIEGSITQIADYDESPGYAVTSLDNGHNALYWGGPTIGYQYTSTVYGTVDASFNYQSLPAVIKYNNMLLTSVHLEAYENDGFTGLSTEDRVENYKYLANLINDVAGTSFYVPPYASPPACNDGIDNDGDNLTDYPADPGCDSAGDDDETDPAPPQCNDGIDNDEDGYIDYPNDPDCDSATDDDESTPSGPVNIVDDGFESGLSAWSIYGDAINDWIQKTDFVQAGSYSAGVIKPGAGVYTYMETSFDASSYTTVTFEYYRMLKGLDAADDFGAEYYSGGAWNYVEHLGDGRENGNFVFKSFSIPNTATKVRFMCEAGAVTEGCWVDSVKVIGE